MAGDVVERAPKGGKKGLRRPKRRIAIRIDMTPMVDIAFLLLIFYMVSTVFSMPQAMEINLPPKDQEEQMNLIAPPLLLAFRRCLLSANLSIIMAVGEIGGKLFGHQIV